MNTFACRFVLVFLLLVGCLQPAWPWGNEGHSAINRVACEKLPPTVPAFLRNACDQLAYIAPEPDRWRKPSELALKRSQEPDHFISLEAVQGMELPPDRYSFYRALNTRREETPGHPDDLLPERVGLQPYVDDRSIRASGRGLPRISTCAAGAPQSRLSPKPTRFSMQDGWGTMWVTAPTRCILPSITTDGWGRIPKGYTTSNTVHWKMEGIFVAANFKQLQFADLVPSQPESLTHPFQDYMHYLYDSHNQVETAYQLEKEGGFDGEGSAGIARIHPQRLAAGATDAAKHVVLGLAPERRKLRHQARAQAGCSYRSELSLSPVLKIRLVGPWAASPRRHKRIYDGTPEGVLSRTDCLQL